MKKRMFPCLAAIVFLLCMVVVIHVDSIIEMFFNENANNLNVTMIESLDEDALKQNQDVSGMDTLNNNINENSTNKDNLDQDTSNKNINSNTTNKNNSTAPSLGGISLGDNQETVANVLGNNYVESTEEDIAGFIGEDMNIWTYENGIVVYFGKMTGKVLRITSTSPNLQTDLGIKVGDNAKTVFETYKPLFEEAVSRHEDEKLEGWYLINDEVVMIFDFDKSDEKLINNKVMPDSSVEEITLAYWKHFD
ncbi:MAG TPA: hypothetical protein GXX37_13810 [Clostridiaceae bacterium]|nr:hypothetical protein [Clostridiaceae bacterium]